VEHFAPEAAENPLRRLYSAKLADAVAAIQRHVRPGAAILDLGGGPGRMAAPLASSYRVTLCDVSSHMLHAAARRAAAGRIPAGNLRLALVDACGPLPFASGSFDAALFIDVLPHISDAVGVLRELGRVVKSGGTLIVDGSNRSPWWMLRYPRALGRRPGRWRATWQSGGVAPEWLSNVRHHRREEYMALLAASGLVTVEQWTYGPFWCPKWFMTRCLVT
jgi:ubiquinone/menaquinone biosynthesis C-methylase UbiE